MRTLGLALVAVMLVSVPVWAAKRKRDMVIPRDCMVQGQEVKTGNYTVEYDDEQPGELLIRSGSREIARTKYTMAELPKPATADTVVFTNKDGVRKIARIEMKGSKMALQVE
ncbi:MAG: hypothetical protein SNJ67_01350 [Chloracidobacterium sp.]|uniref:Uncharacterized protein n=1 Tax=Chloracidobacterium validum TaxID=2821543 RepID=A0ABX8B7E4_9BACT|nr:hypothetical protein [Chloracidobacterium validum]QUW02872.1 hypothetical protein J8C06_11165 [Chloracidobacterium validum]